MWQADRNYALAAERDRVFRLSDVKELRDLTARGVSLLDDRGAVYRSYRGFDALIASMERWIADTESLAKRLSVHGSTLSAIEARGKRGTDGKSFEFDSKEDAWWYSAVFELVIGLRSLTLDDPNGTSVRAIRDRITAFQKIFAHSIADHRANWDACIASIADRSKCPQYDGLRIVPQVGLLPIGRDPQSGLWEFWVVDATGSEPTRGADGKLVLTDDFGVVLVLLPGGKFQMGAQGSNPNGPNYDPNPNEDESPVHEISLSPFFLSKFEMTQHQWILGTRDESWPSNQMSNRSPADSISWDEANTTLLALHLTLPTEAQWEYACRAGTTTPWSTGTEAGTLLGFANIYDIEVNDEIDGDADVGSLQPNSFGLHDMHGNLWEWCADGCEGIGDYVNPIDPVTGEHASDRPRNRALRGGGFGNIAENARSAYRYRGDPGSRIQENGVRPCRVITD